MIYEHLEDINMKEYRICVMQNGGAAHFLIDIRIKGVIKEMDRNYYRFVDEFGKESYYPIANTIIREQ